MTDPDYVTMEQLMSAIYDLGIEADGTTRLVIDWQDGAVTVTRIRRNSTDTGALICRNRAATITTDIPIARRETT